MKKATIEVSLKGKTFVSEFPIEKTTKEYEIEDEAYRVAMLFAYTRILAEYNYPISDYEFGKFIENLDYNYKIQEDDN